MSVNKVLVDGPSHSKHTSSPVTDHYHMGAMEENPMYSAYNMLMDQQSPSRPLRSNYYPYQDFSLDAPTYSMSSSYPIHPDVRLKKLPFYDKIADLLKPSSLVPQGNKRIHDASFQFCLTPQQVTDIQSSFSICPGVGRSDHVLQVQVRFCLMETSCEQDDCFPSNVCLRVNGKVCPLPNPIPTNKPGAEPKRPPRPVNVTPFVQMSAIVANRVDVSWCQEYGRLFAVSIYLVKKLSSNDLLNKLKGKGFRQADYTRGLIKQKLSKEAGGEIATTALRVSLVCPLGRTRMTLPCRSNLCTHMQCFDASVFLTLNELRSTWLCPVCNRHCPYDSLMLDGYFHELLTSSSLPESVTEIQVHQQGTWSMFPVPSSPNKKQKRDNISVDLDVVPSNPIVCTPQKMNCSAVTVDLTSDSDEESAKPTQETASPLKPTPQAQSAPSSEETALDLRVLQEEELSQRVMRRPELCVRDPQALDLRVPVPTMVAHCPEDAVPAATSPDSLPVQESVMEDEDILDWHTPLAHEQMEFLNVDHTHRTPRVGMSCDGDSSFLLPSQGNISPASQGGWTPPEVRAVRPDSRGLPSSPLPQLYSPISPPSPLPPTIAPSHKRSICLSLRCRREIALMRSFISRVAGEKMFLNNRDTL